MEQFCTQEDTQEKVTIQKKSCSIKQNEIPGSLYILSLNNVRLCGLHELELKIKLRELGKNYP